MEKDLYVNEKPPVAKKLRSILICGSLPTCPGIRLIRWTAAQKRVASFGAGNGKLSPLHHPGLFLAEEDDLSARGVQGDL